MLTAKRLNHIAVSLVAISIAAGIALSSLPSWGADDGAKQQATLQKHVKAKPKHKVSSHIRKQIGEASIYSPKLAFKEMANGKKMNPNNDNAASKTLPIGTKAKVTNLETGQSTLVTIEDRGPYVKGRIVDLPPGKAEEIGITLKEGVAKVEVAPIEVPSLDTGRKLED